MVNGYEVLGRTKAPFAMEEGILRLERLVESTEALLLGLNRVKSVAELEEYQQCGQVDIGDELLEYKTELSYNKHAELSVDSCVRHPFS